jgi:hypothetical protein
MSHIVRVYMVVQLRECLYLNSNARVALHSQQARYDQGRLVVVKFCRGIDKDIQDMIANIPIGHPLDDDPQAWYDADI